MPLSMGLGLGMNTGQREASPAFRTIVTAANDGGLPVYTTAAPHGLSSGVTVRVTGNSQPEFNITGTVEVLSATTFSLDGLDASGLPTGTGGRWDIT